MAEDDVVGPLVATFVENLPKRMAAIQRAQERLDYQEVANQAHQMAGAAGGYGFPKMGKVAATIESQARDHVNPKVLARSIESFNSLCNAAMREISRLH